MRLYLLPLPAIALRGLSLDVGGGVAAVRVLKSPLPDDTGSSSDVNFQAQSVPEHGRTSGTAVVGAVHYWWVRVVLGCAIFVLLAALVTVSTLPASFFTAKKHSIAPAITN